MGAHRLPSGNWRVQARRVIDGQRERRSFTFPTKKEALIAAAAWQEESCRAASFPLAEAVRRHVDALRAVRSPYTIRGYLIILTAIERDPVGSIPVEDLTAEDVAAAVRRWAAVSSPKTIRNRHGLISSTLSTYRPGLTLHTPLPESRKKTLTIPTDADIRALLDQTRGGPLELPLILGAFAGMRRGEIAALLREDISDGYIHIRRAAVVSADGDISQKQPKTAAGVRRVPLPDQAAPLLPETGPVSFTSPFALTAAWRRLMRRRKKAGLPDFRFHDLRHFCASRLHALGVPDAYIMQWLGWGSDAVLKAIYRHALPDEEARHADRIRAFFASDF